MKTCYLDQKMRTKILPSHRYVFWPKSHDSGAQWVKPMNKKPTENFIITGVQIALVAMK